MRWLARYATRVAVRRVVALLVVALLAWAGMGRAGAQDFTQCFNVESPDAMCMDEGDGWMGARLRQLSEIERRNALDPSTDDDLVACVYSTSPSSIRLGGQAPSHSNCAVSLVRRAWPSGATCAARPVLPGLGAPGDGAACKEGCEYVDYLDPVDPDSIGIAPTGATCDPTSDNEPIDANQDTDGDGRPDVNDDFPDDPNETDDTDGDGVGDNADTQPNDPNNGQDGTEPPGPDGEPGDNDPSDGPGNESDNVASGGGTCAAPPTCSGDGIQCAQLYQQWKMACALGGKVTGDPSNCSAGYTCTGDQVQCAQIAVARKAMCDAQGQGDGEGDGEGNDANGNGQPDWTEGPAPEVPGDGEDDDVTDFGLGINPNMLDKEEIFGGGSCPVLTITVMGVTATTADYSWWCTLVSIMRAAVLLMGAFTALRILMGEGL